MDQLSLFDLDIDAGFKEQKGLLPVVKAKYVDKISMSWKELFEGFDEIRIITFSSGESFTSELLSMFEYAEVVFGCEDIIGKDISTILAVETALVEKIAKSKYAKELSERIGAGTLKIYVSRTMRSHEKVYCLKSKDGRTRVITGSANMSKTAFEGHQREVFICFDDQAAYDEYVRSFDAFRRECSDNVNQKVFANTMEDQDYLRENPAEIPIMNTVNEQKYIYLEPSNEADENAIEMVICTKNLENELKPMLPKPKKEGKRLVFTAEQLPTVKSKAKEVHEQKVMREKHLPKLHLDYENEQISLNGTPYNLNPSGEDIKRDLQCVEIFLDGLNNFYGNVEIAQNDYFRFMNWYFASIFMPYLRLVANKNNFEVTTFPVVGIMYGDSNGGKSTFVQLLTKLMTGKKLPFCGNAEFTYTEVEKLRRGVEGVPINYDDLDKTQFKNNCDKIIKDDEWGIAEGFINYPAMSISTNKLPSLEAALSKRVIGIRIDIRISKEEGLKCSKKIKDCLKQAGTALYAEYVKRMIPIVKGMADRMKAGKTEPYEDIFIESSRTLATIFSEHMEKVPAYISEKGFSDYFGDKVLGKGAIQKIVSAWKAEPQSFKCNKKENRLTYTYPENANNYELQYLADELPPQLNIQKHSRSLSMDLDEAEEFFGIKFRKGFWHKN